MGQFLTDLLKGRMFGHPIHAMLVHFPSALFPTCWLFDAVSLYTNERLYSLIAFYILGLGVLSGFFAACFGAIDYIKIPPEDRAWKKASLHALLNVTWLIIFGTVFGVQMTAYPNIGIINIYQFMVISFAVFGMIFSNYLGGELVYRYHRGIIKSDQNDKFQ